MRLIRVIKIKQNSGAEIIIVSFGAGFLMGAIIMMMVCW
jgi:hypothetical protein